MRLEATHDLIVLDIMLPRKNGFDVCRDVRQAGVTTPILMLTARGQTVDKVVGLKLGADDYLTKPFEMMELLARVEALLRRGRRRTPGTNAICQIGSLRIDLRGTEVTRNGSVVNLSAREFQLLRYLVEHRGATLSRDEILRGMGLQRGDVYPHRRCPHRQLAEKLEENPKQPQLILTVSGLGYKFSSLGVVRQADEQLSRCHAERNAPRFWARGVEAPLSNQRGTVQ